MSTNRTFKYFKENPELFPWCSSRGRLCLNVFCISSLHRVGNAVAQAHTPASPTTTAQEYAEQTPYGLCACKASEQQPGPASQKDLGWNKEKGKHPCVDQMMTGSDIKKRPTKSGSLPTEITILKLNVS